jgi:hypothetical protein
VNNIGRNIILFEALKKILEIFNSAKIEIALLRGSFFLTVDDLFFLSREMEDIDIAVRKRDFEKAVELVESRGYTLVESGEWAFEKKGSLAVLDIHRGFFEDDFFYEDEFWRCSKEIDVFGFKAKILSPSHQIFHSVWHSAVHHICFKRKWFEDILRIEKFFGGKINWKEVVFLAEKTGLEIPFFVFLEKVNETFPGTLPEEVIFSLSPETIFEKMFLVFYRLVASRNRKTSEIGHLFRFLSKKGFRGKFSFAVNYLLPDKSFMKRRYPVKNLPLLYFSRPFIAFWKLNRELSKLTL